MNDWFQRQPVTPAMPIRETEALVLELQEILRAAKMDNADFSDLGRDDQTEMIKERTKLYRRSWIEKPLEMLIARYDRKKVAK